MTTIVIAIIIGEAIIPGQMIVIILKLNIITRNLKESTTISRVSPTITRRSTKAGAITINAPAMDSWEGVLKSVLDIELCKGVRCRNDD